ncbi:MAG: hypothetical protein H8E12_10450 [Rhodobacteraceae bacterium]|nr:hypothetical protein [Paracoccaceae bacterium]
MITFFKITSTLSFFFIMALLLVNSDQEKRRSQPALEPMIENVRFEHVPTTIRRGIDNEKKFSRNIETRSR